MIANVVVLSDFAGKKKTMYKSFFFFFKTFFKHWHGSAVEHLLSMQKAWVRFRIRPMIFIISQKFLRSVLFNAIALDRLFA